MTFFSNIQHRFPPVGEDGLIEAEPFLSAADEILLIIDFLGPTLLKHAFQRTRSDIAGNITTLRTKHSSDPVKFKTLNSMLHDEDVTKTSYSATVALLWLKRGLEFICEFCKQLVAEEPGKHNGHLAPYIDHAYDLALKRYHNFFLRGLFYVVARIMPYRKDFLKTLANGKDSHEEQVLNGMKDFVQCVTPNLQIINQLYTDLGKLDDA